MQAYWLYALSRTVLKWYVILTHTSYFGDVSCAG